MENYLIAMAVTGCLYALMSLGVNMTWGLAGMVNLGLIGFFAVGAYISALLTLKLGLPIVVGIAAGAAGALYGHYTSYIAPEIFVPLLTLYIKLALLTGGRANNLGAVVGGFFVVFLLESARFVIPLVPHLSAVQGAALREFIIATLLIVILRLRPNGLFPEQRLIVAVPPHPTLSPGGNY